MPPLFTDDLDHVLTHTQYLWKEARGKRFFITGGTGFFGIWLLESFCHINDALGLNMQATVLTRNPARVAAKYPHLGTRSDLSFLKGDVRNFDFPAGEFHCLIHAATEASAKLNAEEPEEMLNTIVDGTRHVLDFAARCGVRKLLLTSSGAVYGKQPPDLAHLPEDYPGAPDPLLPASAYGEGKRVSEHLCVVHALRHGYEAKIARCFTFVGPHLPLDGTYAIGNFLRDAMDGGPIRVAGDGTPFRSYLYASDLAVWLWTILFRGKERYSYNVGSDEAESIADLARLVGDIFGVKARITATPVSGVAPARYVPDTNRAQRELNLRAWTSLRDGIQKTGRWTSSDRHTIFPQ